MINGKRHFLPYTYMIPTFAAPDKVLRKYGIKIDETNWTWNSVVDIVRKLKGANNGKGIHFTNDFFFFRFMLASSGYSFVDYTNKESRFNSQEFADMLKMFKEIKPSSMTSSEMKTYNAKDYMDYIRSGAFVMATLTDTTPRSIGYYNSRCKKLFGQDVSIYPYPSMKGENSIYAQIMNIVGVNAKSKHKAEAFNFIKLLLSKEFQEDSMISGSMNMLLNAVVNKEAYNKDRADWIETGNLSQRLANRMDEMIANIKPNYILDDQIYRIIHTELQDFLEGKRTAEETAKMIDDKVNIYLNE